MLVPSCIAGCSPKPQHGWEQPQKLTEEQALEPLAPHACLVVSSISCCRFGVGGTPALGNESQLGHMRAGNPQREGFLWPCPLSWGAVIPHLTPKEPRGIFPPKPPKKRLEGGWFLSPPQFFPASPAQLVATGWPTWLQGTQMPWGPAASTVVQEKPGQQAGVLPGDREALHNHPWSCTLPTSGRCPRHSRSYGTIRKGVDEHINVPLVPKNPSMDPQSRCNGSRDSFTPWQGSGWQAWAAVSVTRGRSGYNTGMVSGSKREGAASPCHAVPWDSCQNVSSLCRGCLCWGSCPGDLVP